MHTFIESKMPVLIKKFEKRFLVWIKSDSSIV